MVGTRTLALTPRDERRATNVVRSVVTRDEAMNGLVRHRHQARGHERARLDRGGCALSLRGEGRFLTTVLVTDIVGSTRTATQLGDARWRELLGRHYVGCRACVESGRGELVSTTGDGIVAIFAGPTSAIRTAIALQAAAREAGLSLRTGVHTGECEWLAGGLSGVTVHIATRVCALGAADEVLATGTVRDLTMGSMLAFAPRGRHELKGVPGRWAVFGATDPA
jgi:class 3 adenylate cyclase